VGKALDLNHIKHVSLSSSRLGVRRAITQFKADDETRVFLLALRQGAAGEAGRGRCARGGGGGGAAGWPAAATLHTNCKPAPQPSRLEHKKRAVLALAGGFSAGSLVILDLGTNVPLSHPRRPAGLTLVRANNVFLLEPALDPAIEQQAVARVHRIGQVRPVQITRLVIEGSVEMQVGGRGW
jgi:hypothetical protein